MENKKSKIVFWSILALIALVLLGVLGINVLGMKDNPMAIVSVQDNGTEEVVYGNLNDYSFSFLAQEDAQGDVTYELVSQKDENNKTVDYFKLVSERDNQIKVDKKINAGTYTLTIRVNAKGNNKYRSSSKDITYLYTVNKAKGKIDKVPAAISNLVYNGKPQKLITPGESSTGKMLYKVNDGEYSEKIPEATDAGIYTVYFKVEGDENHEDVKEGYLLTSIGNGKNTSYYRPSYNTNTSGFSLSGLIKNITDSSSITYKPTPVGNKPRRNVEYTYDGNVYSNGYNPPAGVIMTGVSSGVNAGVYRAIYTPDIAHCWSDGSRDPVMVTLTIKKAQSSVEFDLPILYYNGSYQQLIDNADVDGGIIRYSLDDRIYTRSIPQAVNAGTYTIYYKIAGDRNHNDSDGTVEVTINRKPLIIPTSDSVYTFNGLPHFVEIDNLDVKYMRVLPGSELSAINAGIYMAEIELRDTNNYEWEDGSDETIKVFWEIEMAPGSIAIKPTARNLTYNGNDQQLVTAGLSLTGKMQYKLGEDGTYSSEIPTGMDAGSYVVYYYSQGDMNHEDTDQEAVTVEIKKADPVIDEYPAGLRIKCDGENHELVSEGKTDDGYFEYRLDNTEWSTTIPQASEEGEYTVYYRVIGDDNHNDLEENYETATIYKFEKAEFIEHPEANEGMFYIGENQIVISEGLTEEGTIEYRLDGGEWSTELPEANYPGTYEVEYHIIGDSTHLDSDIYSLTAEIAQATMSMNIPEDDYVYNGEFQQFPISAETIDGSTAKIEYRTALTPYVEDVPEYADVKLDLLGRVTSRTIYYRATADYHETVEGSYTVTIRKAQLEVPTLLKDSYEYTGEEISAELENINEEYMTVNGTSSATNVGNYSIRIVLNDKHNYEWTSGNSNDIRLTWTIERASVELVEPEAIEGLVYDTNSHELVTPGEAIGGTIKFSLDGRLFTEEIPTGIYDDFYTVYYRVDADSNHVSRPPTEILAIIDAAQMAVNAPDQRYVFDYQAHGEPVTDVRTVDGSEFNVQYSENEEDFFTDVPTKTDAGTYTIYFVVGADHHYPFAESYNIIIDKADGVIESLPVANSGLVYNGQVQQLLAVKAESSTGTVVYSLDGENYSVEAPVVTDAGNYTVYYYSQGDNNHKDTTPEKVEVIVERTKVDKPEVSNLDNQYVYDGNSYGLISSEFDNSLITESGTKSSTEAGNYTLTYALTDKTNYMWVDGTDNDLVFNWKIDKADPVITTYPQGVELTYSGSPQQLVVDGVVNGGQLVYSLDGNNFGPASSLSATDASKYEITYKVLGDNNHNDLEEEGFSVNSVINNGQAYIITNPTPIEGLVYNGVPQALIIPGVSNYGPSVIKYRVNNSSEYSSDTPVGTEVGTYYIDYMIEPTDNYTGNQGGQILVNINRAENPIAVVSDTVTLNVKPGDSIDVSKYVTGVVTDVEYIVPEGLIQMNNIITIPETFVEGIYEFNVGINAKENEHYYGKVVSFKLILNVNKIETNQNSFELNDTDRNNLNTQVFENTNPLYEILDGYIQMFDASGKLNLFKESSED